MEQLIQVLQTINRNEITGKQMANETKTYDITEYSKKALEALRKMEQNQQPGQLANGGKTDVMRNIKVEIKALMDKGYTAQQISDALKVDVFSILPKSITEIVRGKKTAETRKAAARKAAATQPATQPATKAATQPSTQPSTQPAAKQATGGEQQNKSTFAIKQDTPDGEL